MVNSISPKGMEPSVVMEPNSNLCAPGCKRILILICVMAILLDTIIGRVTMHTTGKGSAFYLNSLVHALLYRILLSIQSKRIFRSSAA